jgi:hypothetical protein
MAAADEGGDWHRWYVSELLRIKKAKFRSRKPRINPLRQPKIALARRPR